MDIIPYLTFASALRHQARVANQRRGLVLSGEPLWARQLAHGIVAALAESPLWVGEGEGAVTNAQARQYLGGESRH